jgi:hypothetical protein
MANTPVKLLRAAVDVRPEELRGLFLGFTYYFLILSSYYVIRPIRDEFGAAGGIENLPLMFTGTLLVMLIANALFAALVAKYSRRRFIPIAYRFFHREPAGLRCPPCPGSEKSTDLGRARLLYLGQRLQFICPVSVLGIHG